MRKERKEQYPKCIVHVMPGVVIPMRIVRVGEGEDVRQDYHERKLLVPVVGVFRDRTGKVRKENRDRIVLEAKKVVDEGRNVWIHVEFGGKDFVKVLKNKIMCGDGKKYRFKEIDA